MHIGPVSSDQERFFSCPLSCPMGRKLIGIEDSRLFFSRPRIDGFGNTVLSRPWIDGYESLSVQFHLVCRSIADAYELIVCVGNRGRKGREKKRNCVCLELISRV